ncbi:hypothetical protein LCGC14_1264750 [marine sediment metagenome]|uniref:Uncharacterized protein n=1 Tax=marine sediment metagenome TaxID=412755 RepID=A0A0F9LKW8_9ZZZZ
MNKKLKSERILPKEIENDKELQKTAMDLANLIAHFIDFSELEKLIRSLFNTKEMRELINFVSKNILKHFFPKKKEVKSNGKNPK